MLLGSGRPARSSEVRPCASSRAIATAVAEIAGVNVTSASMRASPFLM